MKHQPGFLQHPHITSLCLALYHIETEVTFDDATMQQAGATILRLLAGENGDEEQQRRDGLLYMTHVHNIKFLHPVLARKWARETLKMKYPLPSGALALHLNLMFDFDAMIGRWGERNMEPLMYHFEAAKRIAHGSNVLPLGNYYCQVKSMDSALKMRLVRCKTPRAGEHIYRAPSFGLEDMPAVVKQLRKGYIAVSKNPREMGMEYLVPFVDAKTGKLLVACVQCTFVKKRARWWKINRQLHKATAYFRTKGIGHFPVVYTTADQEKVTARVYNNGVYFVEHDLFRFTSHFGILRLHCRKIGRVLKNKYSFMQDCVVVT